MYRQQDNASYQTADKNLGRFVQNNSLPKTLPEDLHLPSYDMSKFADSFWLLENENISVLLTLKPFEIREVLV